MDPGFISNKQQLVTWIAELDMIGWRWLLLLFGPWGVDEQGGLNLSSSSTVSLSVRNPLRCWKGQLLPLQDKLCWGQQPTRLEILYQTSSLVLLKRLTMALVCRWQQTSDFIAHLLSLVKHQQGMVLLYPGSLLMKL